MRLLPTDQKFFDLFTASATLTVQTAHYLGDLMEKDEAERGAIADTIKDLERQADTITHEVVTRLDKTFITPLDREDIHFLASSLDNVIDRTDGIARRTKIFRVGRSPSGAVMIADVIHRATLQLLTAVRHLGKSDQYPILEACREVRRLEEEGDALYHEWLGQLFDGGLDALEVIKWKEIYDKLENTLDSAEDVANTLESVAIKHG